jgi:hypothetical protein
MYSLPRIVTSRDEARESTNPRLVVGISWLNSRKASAGPRVQLGIDWTGEGGLHTLFGVSDLLAVSAREKVGDWRVHIGQSAFMKVFWDWAIWAFGVC